jgi:hypothetical protein
VTFVRWLAGTVVILPRLRLVSPGMRRHAAKIGIVLGCLGLLLRFCLAAWSNGSNDAQIWFQHATAIAEHGVGYLLDHSEASALPYNHPPLMGYWSALALKASDGKLHGFSVWMKVPGLLGELLSAALLYRIWASRRRAAGLVFAAYGWSLPLILVSGYHCNTDCAYASLTLLSVYLLQDRRRAFWSGVALAAALNVKLMPLVLVPVLLSQCRSRRQWLLFCAGLALAVVPFIPLLVGRAAMVYGHMVRYGGQQLDWGLNAFLNYGSESPPFGQVTDKLRPPFLLSARYVIMAAVALLSAIAALRRRPLGYEMGALAWALFLVLTSGWCVQYAVCVLPLLFAVDIRRATLYSLFVGIMLSIVYSTNMSFRFPLQALVQYYPFPRLATLFGMVAWVGLAAFVGQHVRALCRRERLVPPTRIGWRRVLGEKLSHVDVDSPLPTPWAPAVGAAAIPSPNVEIRRAVGRESSTPSGS